MNLIDWIVDRIHSGPPDSAPPRRRRCATTHLDGEVVDLVNTATGHRIPGVVRGPVHSSGLAGPVPRPSDGAGRSAPKLGAVRRDPEAGEWWAECWHPGHKLPECLALEEFGRETPADAFELLTEHWRASHAGAR